MAVSELGWATLAEAVSYFENERYKTDHWDNLASDDDKNKALNMGYNRIFYCDDYNVPAAGSETAAQKVELIKAQSEMAYYIALHIADEDRRKGLQAQAVIKAGIVKEDYFAEWLDKLPIPPIVDSLLSEFKKYQEPFLMTEVDRDEDEEVTEDVTDF